LVKPELPSGNSIPVQLGTEKFVEAVPGEQVELLIDKGQKDQVNIQVALEEALTAPVSKGQKIGTLTVRAGEQVLRQVPMVAAEAVPKLTWWDVFVQLLRQIAMGK
jgi:D-alanyl-D-alanine carboxypeptidase (penicillin-binding protein 5/6)